MTFEEFGKLKTITDEVLKITPQNVDRKVIEYGTIYHRYFKQYITELDILKQKTIKKDHLFGTLYKQYKETYQRTLSKGEIEIYIKQDSNYYNLCLEISNQEMFVKYLEGIVTTIKNMNFSITNYIDLKKLNMGI